MTITRAVTKTETLDLLPCPFCNGRVDARDCGYSTFNPGTAACYGTCRREWKLGLVDNSWESGQRWNRLQPVAKQIEECETLLRNLRQQAGILIN